MSGQLAFWTRYELNQTYAPTRPRRVKIKPSTGRQTSSRPENRRELPRDLSAAQRSNEAQRPGRPQHVITTSRSGWRCTRSCGFKPRRNSVTTATEGTHRFDRDEPGVDPTPKHSVSVAGIVVDDQNRVLVIRRRDNGHWEPPGGVLELDETFEEGVRREVLEETGIAVHVERLTGVYKNMARGIVALVFRCTPVAGQPTATPEAKQVQWMTVDKIETVMTPAYYVRVADAFESSARTRSHDGVNPLLGERRDAH